MKLISLSILTLLCSTATFAQSKKEVNKQLNTELLRLQQQQNVLKVQHDSLTAVLNQGKAAITEKSRVLRTRQTSERELSESVRKRYGKLERLDHKSTGDSIITYEQWKLMKTETPYVHESAMKELFKPPFVFAQVNEQPDLGEMKLKEQNVYLSELVQKHSAAIAQNNTLIQREISATSQLRSIESKIDSLYVQSDVFIQQLDRKNNDLQAELYKLRLNYMQKGPKGFSEAYADIFADVYFEYFAKNDAPPMQEKVLTKESDHYMEAEPMLMPPAEPPRAPEIFDLVEVQAEYPGGASAMKEYLQKNIVVPESVRSGKVKGKCYLKFVVSTTGNVSNVKVIRGIPDCKECDAEAVRVVKAMPNWTPAKNNGKPVDCYFNLPISFNP